MRFAFERREKVSEEMRGLIILFEAIVNSFPETAGADYSEIALYDNKNNIFTLAAATGADRDAIFFGRKFDYTMDENKKIFTQKVMESRNPLIIDNIEDYSMSGSDAEMVKRLGINSIAVFPMFTGNRFVGSISFDYGAHTHKYSKEDINRMYELADLAAHMIGYAETLTGHEK
jgi:GAF domain-containing protein